MKKNPLAPVAHFLGRYHVILFFLIVATALTFEIYTLSQRTDTSTNPENYEATITNPAFDGRTIEAIKTLRTRDDSGTYVPPSGRINPFSE